MSWQKNFHLKRKCLKFMFINYELLKDISEFKQAVNRHGNLCEEIGKKTRGNTGGKSN